MTTAPPPSSTPARRPALAPADAGAVARRFVLAGAGWAIVTALLALGVLLPLALGRGAPLAALGPGRLDAAYHWVAQWGMVALPLAGALYRLAGAGSGRPGLGLAGWAFWLWQVALGLGTLAVLAGWLAPDSWAAAPLAAQALLLAAILAWAGAVWQAATAAAGRMSFARLAALVATVTLVAFALVRLLATAIAGGGQAVALAVGTRGLLDGWVTLAGLGVAAALLVGGLGRPLFGRRVALAGLALWLPLAVLASAQAALPDLMPALLTRLVLAAEAARLVPATLLGVALLGTWVGAARPAVSTPLAFASLTVAGLGAAALAASTGVLAGTGAQAFTAWPGEGGLLPPLALGSLAAASATYLVLPAAPGAAWPRRHLALAVGALLLTLAALWTVGLAGAASGPSAFLLVAEARLRLAGALVGLAAAVAWLVAAWRAAPVAAWPGIEGDLRLRPATVLGATVIALVVALFVVLFVPLADPEAVAMSPRTGARLLAAAPLRAAGRARYVAEGCVSCHTQRVRLGAADAAYGPASVRGDYGDGPALAGLRRAGADLMWVGDRYASREAMEVALAVHAPGGAAPMPWLLGPDGPSDAGRALLDYLVGLRSQGEGTP